MAKRKSLSKKTRFEVFKRDAFTCQYCGKKAPDVVLHADHIQPVAEGGGNELINLATACSDCNLGKGARPLSDSTAIEKQHVQLAELQARREQLEMLLEWQQGLVNLERDTVDMIADFWSDLQPGSDSYGLNEYGRGELRKWLSRNSVNEIMEAMRKAATERIRVTATGETDAVSVTEAFHFVPRLLRVLAEEKKEPFIRDAYYIRGILRRRFEGDVVLWEAKKLILESLNLGSEIDSEKDWAKRASSWWAWRDGIEDCIRQLKEGAR